jgi:hypothetical protein
MDTFICMQRKISGIYRFTVLKTLEIVKRDKIGIIPMSLVVFLGRLNRILLLSVNLWHSEQMMFANFAFVIRDFIL